MNYYHRQIINLDIIVSDMLCEFMSMKCPLIFKSQQQLASLRDDVEHEHISRSLQSGAAELENNCGSEPSISNWVNCPNGHLTLTFVSNWFLNFDFYFFSYLTFISISNWYLQCFTIFYVFQILHINSLILMTFNFLI